MKKKNKNKNFIFSNNYNKIENFNKISELNELLRIENLKINNTQLDDISDICKNISNLSEKLTHFKEIETEFQKEINSQEILKNQFINISFFLECTNFLFVK